MYRESYQDKWWFTRPDRGEMFTQWRDDCYCKVVGLGALGISWPQRLIMRWWHGESESLTRQCAGVEVAFAWRQDPGDQQVCHSPLFIAIIYETIYK